ncbi:MAG: RAD55 family ATPase [Halodesulfurarchaeum sp.]
MSYELGDAVPAPLLDAVDPGTNILVSGPAMSGKRELMLEVLGHGATNGDGSVVVTANDGGEQIYDAYQEIVEQESYLRIVDSVGAEPSDELAEVIRPVSSPGDLTGMGIEFSQIATEGTGSGVDRIRVAFDSISAVLMYVELERLFRFLHVFTRQIQSKDWVGLFAIDPESHDQQVINTVNQLFDGVLEIRVPEDGSREIRRRGFGQSPSEWAPLD